MSQHYNQNHSRKEIETVLNEIKNCVSSGKYIISQNDNRQENIDFINEYNIRTERQKSILMQINVEDFCYTLQNTKLGYEYEVYMFLFHKLNYIIQMVIRKPLTFIRNSI